jgi:excisionase family DNA binding protein
MNNHQIETDLSQIKGFISQQALAQKETMNLEEAAMYLGISTSYLYKLTSARKISFFRMGKKLIRFKKSGLDAWMLQQEVSAING